MIGIINYGMGNLTSVQNALNYLELRNQIFDNALDTNKYDKLILPGVGAFGMAMKNLNQSGFSEEVKEAVLIKKIPILGICLGMQLLLYSSSEHGSHEGLKIIRGEVNYLGRKVPNLVIPHVGWNDVFINNESELLKNIKEEECIFYFVHSYYCDTYDRSYVTGITEYGVKFDSMIEMNNIFGCQFHPEKSQRVGLSLLKNFGRL